MIRQVLPLRGHDAFGSGHFGASRGGRVHNGIDYECIPGAEVLSPVAGEVTKLGYCYRADPFYRYVEITDSNNLRHRIFYVQPELDLGDVVTTDSVIATAQDIAAKYGEKMKSHVHYEIKDVDDGYLDPEVFHA